jgi:hypothetical protein
MSMVLDHPSDVMAGLVPATHDLRLSAKKDSVKKDMDVHDISREDGASRRVRRHDAGQMSAGTTTARAC